MHSVCFLRMELTLTMLAAREGDAVVHLTEGVALVEDQTKSLYETAGTAISPELANHDWLLHLNHSDLERCNLSSQSPYMADQVCCSVSP